MIVISVCNKYLCWDIILLGGGSGALAGINDSDGWDDCCTIPPPLPPAAIGAQILRFLGSTGAGGGWGCVTTNPSLLVFLFNDNNKWHLLVDDESLICLMRANLVVWQSVPNGSLPPQTELPVAVVEDDEVDCWWVSFGVEPTIKLTESRSVSSLPAEDSVSPITVFPPLLRLARTQPSSTNAGN